MQTAVARAHLPGPVQQAAGRLPSLAGGRLRASGPLSGGSLGLQFAGVCKSESSNICMIGRPFCKHITRLICNY